MIESGHKMVNYKKTIDDETNIIIVKTDETPFQEIKMIESSNYACDDDGSSYLIDDIPIPFIFYAYKLDIFQIDGVQCPYILYYIKQRTNI